MTRYVFVIKVDVPDTSDLSDKDDEMDGFRPSRQDVLAYVKGAVSSMGGSHHWTSPFNTGNGFKVKVR